MLLAGRQTRLSDLVREPEALSRALARARAIREKAIELAEERGLTVCHLALGIATWDMAGGRRPAAPVLLRRCNLTPVDASHTDFTVDLADEVEVNPVLVEYLRSAHGIVLDPPALARRATVAGGFYPGPVYAALRQACRSVEGFDIAPRLVLSTFNRAKLRAVADLTAGRDVLVGHPVIAALAGDERAQRARRSQRGRRWHRRPRGRGSRRAPAGPGRRPAGARRRPAPAGGDRPRALRAEPRHRRPTRDGAGPHRRQPRRRLRRRGQAGPPRLAEAGRAPAGPLAAPGPGPGGPRPRGRRHPRIRPAPALRARRGGDDDRAGAGAGHRDARPDPRHRP